MQSSFHKRLDAKRSRKSHDQYYRKQKQFPNKICSSLDGFLLIQRTNRNISCTTINASLHVYTESMVCLTKIHHTKILDASDPHSTYKEKRHRPLDYISRANYNANYNSITLSIGKYLMKVIERYGQKRYQKARIQGRGNADDINGIYADNFSVHVQCNRYQHIHVLCVTSTNYVPRVIVICNQQNMNQFQSRYSICLVSCMT